jgi:hypothetical protein
MPSRLDLEIMQSSPLVHYLVRAIVRRIDRRKMQAARVRHLEQEVCDALYTFAVAHRSTRAFLDAFAQRFEASLVGGVYAGGDGRDHTAAPLYVLIPRRYVGHLSAEAFPEMEHVRAAERPDHACYRWDVAAGAVSFDALRAILFESPMGVGTFAFADDDPTDLTLFEVPEPGARPAPPFLLGLPSRTLTPSAYAAVWTLTADLAHGGDEHVGNVVTFRRERRIDPSTGEEHLVPLFSANAVRGILRDIAAGALCQSLGVEPRDLPPKVAHALTAGGTIEAGSDGAGVDLALRSRLRALLPIWDVFGGVWDQQIMAGVLKMHDPILVCRENAWLLHGRLASTMALEAFRERLKRADDLLALRFGTRMAHRDLANSEGLQMIWQTEVVLAGAQFAHSFQLQRLGSVGELSRSYVSHLLDEFRAQATIGAGSARGAGQITFDAYLPGPGEEPLPGPELYLSWLEEHREEVRALLLAGGRAPGDDGAKRGRGRRASVDVAAGGA